MRDVARLMGVSPSGLHRRMHNLADDGAISLSPLRLLPGAIDVASEHLFEPVDLLVSFAGGKVLISQPSAQGQVLLRRRSGTGEDDLVGQGAIGPRCMSDMG